MLFVFVGLAVAFAGTSPLFEPWTARVGAHFFGNPALMGFERPVAATLGIVGGSIVGKWVAAWWLVREPLRRGEAWARTALWVGLVSWFLLDSAVSLWFGAAFNVWLINLAPLVLFGGLLLRVSGETSGPNFPVPRGGDGAHILLARVCWIFVGVGVFVALAMTALPFEIYRGFFGEVYFGGPLPDAMLAYLGFIAGPIGATFLAHFAMLALALRADGGQPWVLRAAVTSVAAWAVVDTTMSLVHGAWFNVLMVNVPTLLALAYPVIKLRNAGRARG